jgi:two-component system, OmpR family, phosphate regulon sensor histidine kinase PhoR
MKKVITDPLLMIATILIIVGFQAYWIKNNYEREEKLLKSKSGIIFRTAMFEMQAKKLNLGKADGKNGGSKLSFVIKDGSKAIYLDKGPREQIIGITNEIRKQLKDSPKKNTHAKTEMVLAINNTSVKYSSDTDKPGGWTGAADGEDKIFRVLYGIDSLQDSLKLIDIMAAVKKSFAGEKLNIPFSIKRNDSAAVGGNHFFRGQGSEWDTEKINEVTVGFAHPVTYRLELSNTTPYLLNKILSPILFSFFLVGFTVISFFIMYRNLSRQRRLTEIKNEFIGNITHELKTPISTVSVAIEAMKNFNALQNPQRTQEYLEIANNELQRLGLLVDKVLKLSMFEKQQVELKQEWFDIKQLVEEVMASMRIQFEKNHAVVNLCAEGNDFNIMADRLHILSVIYNLLDNALKYSQGNPVVGIDINKRGENFIITIKDNGLGIPAAYKEKIFDKFFRVPSGDRHNIKGYGLGLSYVAHIIQQHHGTIEVWSEENKGTVFTIQLPKEYGGS